MKYYNEEWVNNCMEFNKQGKGKEYFEYSKKYNPQWYHEFSFHDSRIISVDKEENYMKLNLEYDDYKHTKYQLVFYNPQVLEECNLENTWWLVDELYQTDNGCEFHFLVDDFNSGNRVLGFYTLNCSRIELLFENQKYFVGK